MRFVCVFFLTPNTFSFPRWRHVDAAIYLLDHGYLGIWCCFMFSYFSLFFCCSDDLLSRALRQKKQFLKCFPHNYSFGHFLLFHCVFNPLFLNSSILFLCTIFWNLLNWELVPYWACNRTYLGTSLQNFCRTLCRYN
jgi:hypothetical protein